MAVVLGLPPTCPRFEATIAVHAVQARPQQAALPQCISMYARCCHGSGLPGVQSGESAPELSAATCPAITGPRVGARCIHVQAAVHGKQEGRLGAALRKQTLCIVQHALEGSRKLFTAWYTCTDPGSCMSNTCARRAIPLCPGLNSWGRKEGRHFQAYCHECLLQQHGRPSGCAE